MTLILNFRNLLTWGKCLQDILHSSTVWLLPFLNCNKNSASGWSAKFHRKMLEQTHLNLLTASGFSSKTEIGRIYFWVDMHRVQSYPYLVLQLPVWLSQSCESIALVFHRWASYLCCSYVKLERLACLILWYVFHMHVIHFFLKNQSSVAWN